LSGLSGLRIGGGPALIAIVVGGTLSAAGAGMLAVAILALTGDGREIEVFAPVGAVVLLTGLLGLTVSNVRDP
jgi:hypothetical protein